MVCPIGAPEIEESKYPQHMETVHGGSQKNARIKEQNLPPLPPEVTPNDLPSKEFLEIANEIDKAEKAPPVVNKPPEVVKQVINKIEPIKLTYKYTGQCTCGNNVSTLEIDMEEKHFVIAYCLIEKKQVESREVVDLYPNTLEKIAKKLKEKEAKKDGNILSGTAVQSKVRPMPEASKSSV